MNLITAQLSLIRLWLVALIPVVIYTLSRTFGNSGSDMTEVWKTVSPAIVPSLATILGTFTYTSFSSNSAKQVNHTFYKITYWVSVVYLASFVVMYAAYPLIDPGPNKTTIQLLETLTTFLQALNVAVVSTCLGVFFTSRNPPTTGHG